MKTDVIIIGAGPFGLSLAAMLRERGVNHRIFGTPMHTWRTAMPAGMNLKSEGFASDLYGGGAGLTLQTYCAARGIPYRAAGLPVKLDVFTAYGEAFQRGLVPQLEKRQVVGVQRAPGGYAVEIEGGEQCRATRVVVAAGITHFAHLPETLRSLPPSLCGHASRFPDPARFAGRRLAVVGAGASATDYAALAAEAGAQVSMIARAPRVNFLQPPSGRPRSLAESLAAPQSGLGPGWRSRMATDAPLVFHRMPEAFRLLVNKRHLGPAGGWWTRESIEQRVDLRSGTSVVAAHRAGESVALDLLHASGQTSRHVVDHVVAATGYRPDLQRLTFLSPELRCLRTVAGAPALSSQFESSSPGLHFIGLASVHDFGPLVRFAFGADFSASRLSRFLARQSRTSVAGYRAPSTVAIPADAMAGDLA